MITEILIKNKRRLFFSTCLIILVCACSFAKKNIYADEANVNEFNEIKSGNAIVEENTVESNDVEESTEGKGDIKDVEEASPKDFGNNKEQNVQDETNKPKMAQKVIKKMEPKPGFNEIDGYTYYYKSDGTYYKNIRIKIGNYFYYFDDKGRLVTGKVFNYNGNYYYAGQGTGINKAYAGWVKTGGNKYYAKNGGVLYKYIRTKIGKYFYCFDTKARLIVGKVYTYRGNYYYAGYETGINKAYAGWVKLGNKKYYSQNGGILAKNKLIKLGSDLYYAFNSKAELRYEPFLTKSGIKVYPNSKSGALTKKDAALIRGRAILFGIDVSYAQGKIDWKKAKARGVKFAFIRVGYTSRSTAKFSTNMDSTFKYNIENAIRNGIAVGVYYFSQAKTASEGAYEARYVNALIKKYKVTLPIVIDTEASGAAGGRGRADKLSRARRTEVMKGFCNQIKKLGKTPMIYASTSWLNTKLDMSKLKGYKVWVAQYYTKVTYKGKYEFWQYSSTGNGKYYGANSKYIDMNYWYMAN